MRGKRRKRTRNGYNKYNRKKRAKQEKNSNRGRGASKKKRKRIRQFICIQFLCRAKLSTIKPRVNSIDVSSCFCCCCFCPFYSLFFCLQFRFFWFSIPLSLGLIFQDESNFEGLFGFLFICTGNLVDPACEYYLFVCCIFERNS